MPRSLRLLGLLLLAAAPARAQWQALETPRRAYNNALLPAESFTTFNGTIVASFDEYDREPGCTSCHVTYASRDGGATWTLVRDPDGALFGASSFVARGGVLYAMHQYPVDTRNGRAYRSTDGLTWTLAAPPSGAGVLHQLQVSADGALWARSAGARAILRSAGGAAWANASAGLPAGQMHNVAGATDTRVFAMAGSNLYVREAAGTAWTAVPYFTSYPPATVVEGGTTLYAPSLVIRSVTGPPYMLANYLHRSTDGGTTWSALPAHPRQTIFGMTAAADGRIATAFRDSVAVSADGGATWAKATTPGQSSSVSEMRIEGGYLYVLDWGNDRLYRRPLSDFGVTTAAEAAPAASALRLDLPAPHPARGTVTFRFAVAAPGPVRLAVADLLGREVAVLHDGPASGDGMASFDVSRLAPGVYVARLTGGDAHAMRTFVVRP